MKAMEVIPHPRMRIVIHSWNGKWIVEFEAAAYKQAIRMDQELVPSVEQVKSLLTPNFLIEMEEQFQNLHTVWSKNFKANQA